MTPREVWTSQCEVARDILAEDGLESALSYLIGGKLLNFLQLAEDYPEWRDEIPNFIAEIENIFGGWQIAEYLNTGCRLGALAHAGGAETHPRFGVPRGDEMELRVDSRDVALLAWARQLLLDDDA